MAHRGILISDFNIDNFAAVLTHSSDQSIQASSVPFGQVMPTLLNAQDAAWRDALDFAVVWTRPEGVIESFRDTLRAQRPTAAQLLNDVDAYVDAITLAADRVTSLFVPTWVVPNSERGFGLLDLRPGGIQHSLAAMNMRLTERLAEVPNVYVLDARRWMEVAGRNAFSPKFWLMGKIPFTGEVFKQAAQDIGAALDAVAGQTRKLIVLDLDDTLWGGIVGDDGWENLKLGGHDAIGESFADFQQALKTLKNRGILLAIVSKNTESVALEAIEQHPEMILRRDDFVGWRINWMDKAANISELVADLNLGLQSVVFIDDNPAERSRVREQLPEVLVPEWPTEKMLYCEALRELRCFDSAVISSEDADRTAMYVADRDRQQARTTVGTMDDWLESLDLSVTIEPLDDSNVKRIVQLLNKTNQMNLSTRRMTEAELTEWARQPGTDLFGLRVRDRFGDSGLTGIVSMQCDGPTYQIVDFILSCRVFGRQIEQLMVHHAVQYAANHDCTQVTARYLPTKKNKPCMEFWQGSGFSHDVNADLFTWPVADAYDAPSHIHVEHLQTSPS